VIATNIVLFNFVKRNTKDHSNFTKLLVKKQ